MGCGKAKNSENPSRIVQKNHDERQKRFYKRKLKKTLKIYTKEEIEKYKKERGIE